MIVNDLYELTIVGVYDRGVPNQERIVIRANQSVNLGQYGVMLGIRAAGNSAFPIRDNLLWFGDALINTGDWIFIYTGIGEAKVTTLPNSQERLYSIHWGRDKTILHHPDLVPILFRVDAVQVPYELPALPQKPKMKV
ncbi:hypothetical protein [Candidatus Manganitrophus noduliformans]|uniref:Uncharacterized protein n=1 Tax=Candidatus Manganitrophus noduliformans TaxID=2606439 RepID=A0A7X6DNZ2_9BACT|nr:hypothetical protein [Candidatus Manganitrophus noduliformans]NKE70627.1 hypothetical protein [Candidatus Manganitrophus noduliformans]